MRGGRNILVQMELQVPIPPVQCPLSGSARVSQPGDRVTHPFLLIAKGRLEFDDGHAVTVHLCLESHKVPDSRGYLFSCPAVNAGKVQFGNCHCAIITVRVEKPTSRRPVVVS